MHPIHPTCQYTYCSFLAKVFFVSAFRSFHRIANIEQHLFWSQSRRMRLVLDNGKGSWIVRWERELTGIKTTYLFSFERSRLYSVLGMAYPELQYSWAAKTPMAAPMVRVRPSWIFILSSVERERRSKSIYAVRAVDVLAVSDANGWWLVTRMSAIWSGL